MNRRQFTKGLAALGLVPMLPASVSAASAAATATPVAAASNLYPWAAYYAQIHNKCSPTLLAKHLRIPLSTAEGLYAKLVTRGVVTAPDIAGLSQAVKPYYKNLRLSGGVVELKSQKLRSANSQKKLGADTGEPVAEQRGDELEIETQVPDAVVREPEDDTDNAVGNPEASHS